MIDIEYREFHCPKCGMKLSISTANKTLSELLCWNCFTVKNDPNIYSNPHPKYSKKTKKPKKPKA